MISPNESGNLPPRAEREYNNLITGIRNNDQTAPEQLTLLLSRGVRILLSKKLHSEDVEYQVRDTLSAVVDAIKTGTINDFRQLLRFTLTTLKRQRPEQDAQVEGATRIDHRSPWRSALSERSPPTEHIKQIAETIARKMSVPEMQVLRMYYVDGETQETICRVRNLSADEFLQIKVKAKAAAVNKSSCETNTSTGADSQTAETGSLSARAPSPKRKYEL
jgi:hypothetical protein